jgi:hypothetical protein
MLLPLFCAVAVPARAQTGNDDFQQAVAAYQQSPNDLNKAEKVIRMAAAMDKLPPIPEEARRHFVRGTALFKDAKTTDDYEQVGGEFKQAVHLAPWWPEARCNWALEQEAGGVYDWAIKNMKLYLLFKLSESDARAAQDKIYVLEAKQEKAAKAQEEENSPQAVAAREQKSFEDLLRKIDGRRYSYKYPGMATVPVIDINGKFLTEGQIWPQETQTPYPGGPHPGYNKGNHVEIQGRVTNFSESTQFQSELIRIELRYTISEDGDTITWHRTSNSSRVPDEEHVYEWQR